VGWHNEGSFGFTHCIIVFIGIRECFAFAKRWLLCRAKTNVPECAVGFLYSCLYAAKKFIVNQSSVFSFYNEA